MWQLPLACRFLSTKQKNSAQLPTCLTFWMNNAQLPTCLTFWMNNAQLCVLNSQNDHDTIVVHAWDQQLRKEQINDVCSDGTLAIRTASSSATFSLLYYLWYEQTSKRCCSNAFWLFLARILTIYLGFEQQANQNDWIQLGNLAFLYMVVCSPEITLGCRVRDHH